MLNLPTLSQITKSTFSISAFEGLDRRVGAGEKTLYHTKNMSVRDLPILSTRRGRKKLFTPQAGEKVTGIFCFDKAYMTTSYNGRTRFYYGDDFSSLTLAFTSEADELITSLMCVFDNRVCLFNLKTELGSKNTIHATPSTMSFASRYEVPDFVDVTVYAGRVIGCRRKQLRGCAYGDFSAWDSTAVYDDPTERAYFKNCETKSNFTACTTYKNRAIFFTADEMYELYGNNPDQFNLVKIADVGCVSRFALCEVDGKLFFVSKEGVMKYTGTVPVMISDSLCDVPRADAGKYSAALCGSGRTLYVCYKGNEDSSFYTYNTEMGLWSKEDDFMGKSGASMFGRSFFASEDGVWELEKSYSEDAENNDGASFDWEIVTQDIHHYRPVKKRSACIDFYLIQPRKTRVCVYAAYDGGDFELVRALLPHTNGAICIPLGNRDFQSIRIKICGSGEAQIHYLSRMFSLGGNIK
ncbi:MAG: hypothetical protein UHH95_01385 [Oscillospiraceae bacterium]|nr:hypothetical protein [Oscillospiraceae bacterium]